MKTHPFTTLIGGLIIGLLLGAIGMRQWLFDYNTPIAEENERIHNEALQKLQFLTDERDEARSLARAYKAVAENGAKLFEDYAEHYEQLGSFDSIKPRATAITFRAHARKLRARIEAAP
jgi:hypothetical protein